MGQVTTWFMTEEERLAYIAKHPIRPTQRPKGSTLVPDIVDYKWRWRKANEAMMGKRI